MAKENTRELGNAGFISQFALREIIIYAHQISSCRFTASRGAFRAEEIRGVLPSRSYKPRRTKRQYWAAAKRNERVWGARSRGTLLNSTLRSHLPATKRDSLPKQGCLLQTHPHGTSLLFSEPFHGWSSAEKSHMGAWGRCPRLRGLNLGHGAWKVLGSTSRGCHVAESSS